MWEYQLQRLFWTVCTLICPWMWSVIFVRDPIQPGGWCVRAEFGCFAGFWRELCQALLNGMCGFQELPVLLCRAAPHSEVLCIASLQDIHRYLSLYIQIYVFYSSPVVTIFSGWGFTHKILPGSSMFAGKEDISAFKSLLAWKSISILNHCISYSKFVTKAHICAWNASWPT